MPLSSAPLSSAPLPERRERSFLQVDVFTSTAYLGNPVAVVLDAEGLSDEQMRRLACWTNLSETTFVLPPTDAAADYRVRIFHLSTELLFAGHPTLGTAHAWLSAHHGNEGAVIQQCEAGLVPVRRAPYGLAFQAPPLVRSGPAEAQVVDRVASMLNLRAAEILDAQWVDNGPGWLGLVLADAQSVLAVRPGPVDCHVGVVGFYPPGSELVYEVRAFFPKDGASAEDPITGSLNASLAQWLVPRGRAKPPYVAGQGTVLGRQGRVHIDQAGDGAIWVGGGTITCISGTVTI
jgi:PhzF family phenazine biosynthesis protein